MKLRLNLTKKSITIILLAVYLLVASLLHGLNMFKYPYYENDEGVYMSQAWAVSEQAELAPYTYWYDHAPGGWFQLATWAGLHGGNYFAYGTAVNTGRVLMLLVHLMSGLLVFFITLRTTKRTWLAWVAAMLFSVSPLGIYFQRRVLLDNLMAFWMLASTALLVAKEKTPLRNILGSGFAFAIAILTKVTAVMFGPAFLVFLFQIPGKVRRRISIWLWLAVSGLTTLLYIIYAMIKSEFVPSPSGDRVSLLGSLRYQSSRGTDVGVFDAASSFMSNLQYWRTEDPVLVWMGGIALVLGLLVAIKVKRARFVVALAWMYAYFFMRGGLVINFYFIPIMPFIMIVTAVVIDAILRALEKFKAPHYAVFGTKILVVVMLFVYMITAWPTKALTTDETTNQVRSLQWIKQNLNADDAIIIDSYGITELRDPGYINEKVFVNADWFYKVSLDPAIRDEKYEADWRKFDYISATHEMIKQVNEGEHPIIEDAIANSYPTAKWFNDSTAFVDIQKLISTNGDWTTILKINGEDRERLLHSWQAYKHEYIQSYGQIVDPRLNITTSEGQSYAMLRAAWINDEDTFKGVWAWTRDHLQHRVGDDLLSWKWQDDQLADSLNATDADLDIAMALMFASQIFENPQYLEDAKIIIDSIWDHTVVNIRGVHYQLPMHINNASANGNYLFNPSYLSPAHYRLFAEIDDNPDHQWEVLAQDSYDQLERIRRTYGGLPPNWCLVNEVSGFIDCTQTNGRINTNDTAAFGYDAFRTLWRVGLDVEWNQSEAASNYLSAVLPALNRSLRNSVRGFPAAVVNTSGARLVGYSDPSIASVYPVALKLAGQGEVADTLHDQVIDRWYTIKLAVENGEHDKYHYGEEDDYYAQNWGWFNDALYTGNLPNLWTYFRDQDLTTIDDVLE